MKTKKDVKILFYQLFLTKWKKGKKESSTLHPFVEVKDIIASIKKLARLKKFYDLNNGKFFFLETVEMIEDDSDVILKGFFKSARNEFRPNLINKKTGEERPNPKQLTEGDIEKTHFVFKIAKKREEVYLLLEYNFHGITCSNIIDYFSHFYKSMLKATGNILFFTIVPAIIPGNDFIDGLNLLKRAKIAEVHFDKQLLGSNALNFSNRTVSIKQDLKLIAKAEAGESIKEVAVDLFNKFNQQGSGVTRVRIFGSDDTNSEVILDTLKIIKNEHIKVDLNPDTGEVMTPQIISALAKISETI
jgi:hypothetical protein